MDTTCTTEMQREHERKIAKLDTSMQTLLTEIPATLQMIRDDIRQVTQAANAIPTLESKLEGLGAQMAGFFQQLESEASSRRAADRDLGKGIQENTVQHARLEERVASNYSEFSDHRSNANKWFKNHETDHTARNRRGTDRLWDVAKGIIAAMIMWLLMVFGYSMYTGSFALPVVSDATNIMEEMDESLGEAPALADREAGTNTTDGLPCPPGAAPNTTK